MRKMMKKMKKMKIEKKLWILLRKRQKHQMVSKIVCMEFWLRKEGIRRHGLPFSRPT